VANDLFTLFRKLTLGVYVVGVTHASRRDAFTAASIMQTSYKPLLLALAINPEHACYALLCAAQSFAVSVLNHDQIELARCFGTPAAAGTDKMQCAQWRSGREGAPILRHAIAYFECAVRADVPAGDHRLVLGQVRNGGLQRLDGQPLLYAATDNLDQSAALYPTDF
jgi:flavin reductase (DIM6/NTAB) family NADH-FMN oxidoreductase RutF